MVRFTVLASGSKGNCTVVTGGNTRILVDAGLSCRELFRRMKLADEDPATLDAIIVTHEHSDHVAGLAVTAGSTMIAEAEQTIAAADRQRIFVVGVREALPA